MLSNYILGFWLSTNLLAIDISETQYKTEKSFYQIMISEMKRRGQGQNITLTKSNLNS